jgi:hypothetical protein
MEDRDWIQHLLPLPKKFSVTGALRCAPHALAVEVCPGSVDAGSDILAEAVCRLHEAIGIPSDSQSVLAIETDLTIELRLVDTGDSDARGLAELPNSEQSYRIFPVGPDRLRICAVQPVGVLYGALTLCQLLHAGHEQDTIEVPLVDILDWPDIEERGLWNFPDPTNWIPWMAGMKLNYGKMADTAHPKVIRGQPGSAAIDTELYAAGRRLGFSYVPYIVHLNFLHDIGLFSAYPELAGKGDAALAGRYFAHKQGNQHRAPCASQPVLVDLLCDWLTCIAEQGADEISCWLSERPCQCQCQQCTPVGQFLLETRAFLAAWELARSRHPQLSIRLFSSTTTAQQDDRILAELPLEVKFERACATTMDRVRSQPRDRFRNHLIDSAAAAGRWVASYDVPIGAFGNVDTPEFKVPQFSAQRIHDFVAQLHERGYAGAYGMLAWATMAREVCGFAISALAEFSWNSQGRSAGDFAVAWATREGLPDPSAIGTWAALLGDVEFDVFDSDFPMCYSWGHAAQLVEQNSPPRLGEGMFRHFAVVEDFADKLETCQRALRAIEPLDVPTLTLATHVTSSYIELHRTIWDVSHRYAHADLSLPETQQLLLTDLLRLDAAGTANTNAIKAWRTSLGPEPWHHRVHDAISATQETVHRIDTHIRHHCLY